MYKMSLVERLDFIKESIGIIKKRFSLIESVNAFIADDNGLEKLDSII